MTDAHARIDTEVKSNDVVLFMKGTPQFPMCGFSGQVVQILDYLGVPYQGRQRARGPGAAPGHQGLLELADDPAALRQGRVRRRLRHHPRDVPGRRAAAASRRQGRSRSSRAREDDACARQGRPAAKPAFRPIQAVQQRVDYWTAAALIAPPGCGAVALGSADDALA